MIGSKKAYLSCRTLQTSRTTVETRPTYVVVAAGVVVAAVGRRWLAQIRENTAHYAMGTMRKFSRLIRSGQPDSAVAIASSGVAAPLYGKARRPYLAVAESIKVNVGRWPWP